MKFPKNRRYTAMALSAAMLIGGAMLGAAPANASPAQSTPISPYELNVGDQSTTLAEGESVVYPMVPTKAASATFGTASPNVVYPGDTGTITVTAARGVYHYDIAMHIPVTNFIGAFSITDFTSGVSGGSVTELVFSGDIPTSRLRNHVYSGTIAGEAFFAGVSVAHTGPNNTRYTYSDF